MKFTVFWVMALCVVDPEYGNNNPEDHNINFTAMKT